MERLGEARSHHIAQRLAAECAAALKKGWDIEGRDGAGGTLRLIEVKGRHADARDVVITKLKASPR